MIWLTILGTIRRGRCLLLLSILLTAGGCSGREHLAIAKSTIRLQLVCEGYGEVGGTQDSPRLLDVREFSPALGDTFGGGSPACCCEHAFVLMAITNGRQALVRYSDCLLVTKHWGPSYSDLEVAERRGPDTLTITTDWRHLATGSVCGGCYISVRIAE